MVNKLYIIGDINDESYAKFTEELAELENTLRRNDMIEVELMSDGGSAYTALAFYDRIMNSKHVINITATGFTASAAALILAAGNTRRMTKNAWLMTHEDTVSDVKGLSVTEGEREVKHLRELENQWNTLLSRRSNLEPNDWEVMNKKTTYLTAQQCLNIKFIEEIV